MACWIEPASHSCVWAPLKKEITFRHTDVSAIGQSVFAIDSFYPDKPSTPSLIEPVTNPKSVITNYLASRQEEVFMSSPASIMKHPLHPMLVALPIGLWVFALVCDVVAAAGGTGAWSTVARYSIAGGLVGAIAAAVPGLIDYFSIDEAAMRRIANFHLLVNLGAVVIFAINLWTRFSLPSGSPVPLMLSIVGVIGIGIGGWLGGEMVYVKGMAVEAVDELAKKVQEQDKKEARLRRAS